MEQQVFYNFENSIFSKNGMFRWPFSFENAELVAYNITQFSTVFELLMEFPGFDELLLRKSIETIKFSNTNEGLKRTGFTSLKVSEQEYFNTLLISTWSDEMIVGSAAFFILENLAENREKFSRQVRYIIRELSPLAFSSKFSKIFVEILQETKIIDFNLSECCIGLKLFLTFRTYVKELQNEFLFNKETLINLLFLLKATENEKNYIVKSCFDQNNISELKHFIEKNCKKIN